MSADNANYLPMPSLRNLQSFIEVANTLSINGAAENLNITPSAVSHQISTLEKFINKKLFTRNGKGVALTATGKKYLKEVSGPINTIGRATDKIINSVNNEILRIHSSPSFGFSWLIKRIGVFRELHPDITINLSCSYENVQFARDNIDIDIRHGIPDWDAYTVLTIKNDRVMVMASPDYLEKNIISTPLDLQNNVLIHSTSTMLNWNKWFSYHNIKYPPTNHELSFDRSYMSFEAASLGLGVILESSILGMDYMNDGRLSLVFSDEYSIPINAHHIVFPHSNEKQYKVKTFIKWIASELTVSGFTL